MTSVLSALINPDSIEHDLYQERIKLLSFLALYICPEPKQFFPKPLRWFNEYHKDNVQLSNKQILFNTFEDSFPLQMSNSTQSKLLLLALLQKKYLYTHLQEHRNET